MDGEIKVALNLVISHCCAAHSSCAQETAKLYIKML
jgi:hypothetical protein